jgi:hypothetical protein
VKGFETNLKERINLNMDHTEQETKRAGGDAEVKDVPDTRAGGMGDTKGVIDARGGPPEAKGVPQTRAGGDAEVKSV